MSAPAIAYTRILWRGWPLRATQSDPMLSDGCESASNSEGRPVTQRAGSTPTSGTHDDQWLVPASTAGCPIFF
jgi:hypothetical protein